MFSLLLTLLFMATEKPELKLQEVQQPIMVEQRKETIGGIGYTQRPINARTQTRNRYLDSVQGTDSKRSIASSTTTITTIPSFTYIKTGKYPWDKTDGEFYISEDGTYFINSWAIFSAATVTNGLRMLTIYKNGDALQLDYILTPYAGVSTQLTISELFNLDKGDIITVGVRQSSTETLDVSTKLKIFKTS